MNLKNNSPLFITILASVALVCATVIYAVSPSNPNLPVVFTALFGFVGTVSVSLLNGQATREKVEQVTHKVDSMATVVDQSHLLINSQSEQLKAANKIVDTEIGRKQGVAEEKAEQASL